MYDRPRHYFTAKDLERIAKSVSEDPDNLPEELVDMWINWARGVLERLLPGFLRQMAEIMLESYRRYWKAAINGEFKSVIHAWKTLVVSVVDGWKDIVTSDQVNWVQFLKVIFYRGRKSGETGSIEVTKE